MLVKFSGRYLGLFQRHPAQAMVGPSQRPKWPPISASKKWRGTGAGSASSSNTWMIPGSPWLSDQVFGEMATMIDEGLISHGSFKTTSLPWEDIGRFTHIIIPAQKNINILQTSWSTRLILLISQKIILTHWRQHSSSSEGHKEITSLAASIFANVRIPPCGLAVGYPPPRAWTQTQTGWNMRWRKGNQKKMLSKTHVLVKESMPCDALWIQVRRDF